MPADPHPEANRAIPFFGAFILLVVFAACFIATVEGIRQLIGVLA